MNNSGKSSGFISAGLMFDYFSLLTGALIMFGIANTSGWLL